LREIADRDFEFAERLDGLRRNLNVAHQVDLANLADPHLFLQCILLADLQDFVRFPHPHALSIDIERAQVISRRYHLPHRARRRLLGHAILACREKIDLNSNRRAQAERVSFIRQAYPHQRAAWTFRRIHQRRRKVAHARQFPGFQYGLLGLQHGRLVE